MSVIGRSLHHEDTVDKEAESKTEEEAESNYAEDPDGHVVDITEDTQEESKSRQGDPDAEHVRIRDKLLIRGKTRSL